MENTIAVPQKLKIEWPYDPAISLLVIYPQKLKVKSVSWKDICPPMFFAALSTIAKMWRTYVSIDRGMDKEDVVYLYNGVLLSHKKEWNNAICSNMDEPRDYLTKWRKPDREGQMSYDIAYMWNLKKMIQMNLYTKQK